MHLKLKYFKCTKLNTKIKVKKIHTILIYHIFLSVYSAVHINHILKTVEIMMNLQIKVLKSI